MNTNSRRPEARPENFEFAKRLVQSREAKGWTQEETAKSVGVSLTGYQDWEYAISYPRRYRLKAIAELLGVAEQWLTTGSGPRTHHEEGVDVEIVISGRSFASPDVFLAVLNLIRTAETIDKPAEEVASIINLAQKALKN